MENYTLVLLLITVVVSAAAAIFWLRRVPKVDSPRQTTAHSEPATVREAPSALEASVINFRRFSEQELTKKLRAIWPDKRVRDRNLDYIRRKTPNGYAKTEFEIMEIAYEDWEIENRAFAAGPVWHDAPPAPPVPPPLKASAAAERPSKE